MVDATFCNQLYLDANPDVANIFRDADATTLEQHYTQNGFRELRGISEKEKRCFIDHVSLCDAGYILIVGWRDPRLYDELIIRFLIGYYEYRLSADEICYYVRPDVDDHIGTHGRKAGFLALLKLPVFFPHTNFDLYVNDRLVYRKTNMQWLAPVPFLEGTLVALALLSDRPLPESFGYAATVAPSVCELWHDCYSRFKVHEIYRSSTYRAETSLVIVVYKEFPMLGVQLRKLAPLVCNMRAEVLIVANAVNDIEGLIRVAGVSADLYRMNIVVSSSQLNTGYSFANNYGAETAATDNLYFVNPDIFPIERNNPRHLSLPAIDIISGARLYYGNGSLMHNGMFALKETRVDPFDGSKRAILRVEHYGKGRIATVNDDAAPSSEKPNFEMVSAAFMTLKRPTFNRLGQFPMDYIYAYYEDADFCLHAALSGAKMELLQGVELLHLEGVGGASAPGKRAYMWLNRFVFSSKYADAALIKPEHNQFNLI